MVFGLKDVAELVVTKQLRLNALTGIDGFWTKHDARLLPSVRGVLTPLRALMVFGRNKLREMPDGQSGQS